MRYVNIIHRLHRVVENEPRKLLGYRQVERDKESERCGVEIPRAKHSAGSAACSARTMGRDQFGLQPARRFCWDTEGRNVGLVRG